MTLFKAVQRWLADARKDSELVLSQSFFFATFYGLFDNVLPIKANVPFHLFLIKTFP
jgi:hypothetical protein